MSSFLSLQDLLDTHASYSRFADDMPTVGVRFQPANGWRANQAFWYLAPIYDFGNVNSGVAAAAFCEVTNLPLFSAQVIPGNRAALFPSTFNYTLTTVSEGQLREKDSPVKFIFTLPADFENIEANHDILPILKQLENVLYISHPPEEIVEGGRNYRRCTAVIPSNPALSFGLDAATYVVSTDHRSYNYLDRGHVVFFFRDNNSNKGNVFIANQLSLNTYLLAAAFYLSPDTTAPLLRDRLFARGNDLQTLIGRAEAALPKQLRETYGRLRAVIRGSFDLSANDVMLGKFIRGEAASVELNNIKFTKTSAEYETVRIDAQGLSDLVLDKIDASGLFDIYQIIESYVNHIVDQIKGKSLKSDGRGFNEEHSWQFSINSIPITLSVATTHTRRLVNGKPINNDELVKVLRRASCFHTVEDYDRFVTRVSRASLRVHDAVANGYPVKLCTLDARNDNFGGETVTPRHPKVYFTMKGAEYHIFLTEDKTETRKIGRFVGFLDALDRLNQKADDGYIRGEDPSGLTRRGQQWIRWHLKDTVRKFADATLTDEQLNPLIEWLLKHRLEAERKSEQLLASVVEQTKATPTKWKSVDAFEITGESGKQYTVEKEAPFKTWESKTGQYVCIVDGRGEMGVGYDALVARLLALKNDRRVADRISTLRV